MPELNDFYNDGFGWACRHCSKEMADEASDRMPRHFREGEAESKTPSLANKALARWADPAHRYLMCPNCGIRELAEKA